MRNILKIELKKSFGNKYFIISLFIGCSLSMLCLIYNAGVYQDYLQLEHYVLQEADYSINPYHAVFTLFNHWIGGEGYSLGSSLFFFIFPLLTALPYGWSYCEEKRNGYARMTVVLAGKKAYFLSKYIAVFFSRALAMTIPLIFSLLCTAMFFPAVTPVVLYDVHYSVFYHSLMSSLYYTAPFLYVFLYLVIDFLFGGILGCISLAACTFIKYKVINVIVPMLLCLGIQWGGRFLYVSTDKAYKEISPLLFLRGAQTSHKASWDVILGEFVLFLIITLTVTMIWERKHEIY